MNHDYVVLATSEHPLYNELKKNFSLFYDLKTDEAFETPKGNYQQAKAVFDFTLRSNEKKKILLKFLSIQYSCPIISDLSLYWGDYFLKSFSSLKGSLGCAFYSPEGNCEVYAQDDATMLIIEDFFKDLSISPVRVLSSGIGFIYPRTISQIINEAYFSLEDELASAEDIDRAMKYGVNYPLGPIEWCQKIGPRKVVRLLDELHRVTKESRYRTSTKLRLMAKDY